VKYAVKLSKAKYFIKYYSKYPSSDISYVIKCMQPAQHSCCAGCLIKKKFKLLKAPLSPPTSSDIFQIQNEKRFKIKLTVSFDVRIKKYLGYIIYPLAKMPPVTFRCKKSCKISQPTLGSSPFGSVYIFIENYLSFLDVTKQNGGFWSSGTNRGALSEDNHSWCGSNTTFVKTENVWSAGQPNDVWGERCAQFAWYSDSLVNVALHDYSCSTNFYIVCEQV